uniref:Uncharacterized protein n=1 Tax=Ditylenchus dipsaci TaxID=166011 RepID=A0A915DVU4_9BILA
MTLCAVKCRKCPEYLLTYGKKAKHKKPDDVYKKQMEEYKIKVVVMKRVRRVEAKAKDLVVRFLRKPRKRLLFKEKDGSRICSLLPTDEMKTHRYDEARSLYEGARRGFHVSTNGSMLGYRINREDGT